MIADFGTEYDAMGWCVAMFLDDGGELHLVHRWDGDHEALPRIDNDPYQDALDKAEGLARRFNDGGPQRERVLRRLGR